MRRKGGGMTYDRQCLELAKSFIRDCRPAPSTHEKEMALCDELAKDIQRTIEDFIADRGLET